MALTNHPESFPMENSLEVCESFPLGEICIICQQAFSEAPTEDCFSTDPSTSHDISSKQTHLDGLQEPVNIKVCGDKHFFHRVCIESWFKSATPNLNTCPVDRKVCYGSAPVRQRPVNLPEIVSFYDFDYGPLIGTGIDHDRPDLDALWNNHDLPDPDTLLTYGPGPWPAGLVADYRRATDIGPLLGRMMDDLDAYNFTGSRNAHAEELEMVFDSPEDVAPGHNDPFAASIARGYYLLPHYRAFSSYFDPELDVAFPMDTELAIFFGDEEEDAAFEENHASEPHVADSEPWPFTRLTDD